MKRFLKKLLCWTLISNCFLMTANAAPAWPAGPDIQAEAGVVIDMDSGAILGGKAYDTPYPPASITKLLTALLVMEHSKLDDVVTFSSSAVNNVESDSGNKLNVETNCPWRTVSIPCWFIPVIRQLTRWQSMWPGLRKRS